MANSTSHFNEQDELGDHEDLDTPAQLIKAALDLKQDYQMLIANSAVSRWYKREYEKLEAKFLDDLAEYERLGVAEREDRTQLYYNTVLDIFNIYPKPLFELARKLTIINDATAN